jgi:uncharacterized NAD-dependent epimerase/dehydratase family protein
VVSVIDSRYRGSDSGVILDGFANGIPIVADLGDALIHASRMGLRVSSFIIGLDPDGGRLPANALESIRNALVSKLDIYSGLHDYVSDDEEFRMIARENGCSIHDIRKPKETRDLHYFSGKISEVRCLKVAVLGTDSAVGKRTTAWKLVHSLNELRFKAELIGTGPTAWLQGARYSIILDSIVNDYIPGEIEHVIHQAWMAEKPDVLVIEGQGSLLNPVCPGGYELLAAGRPDVIILQHAPKRKEYTGFPGYGIQPLQQQINVIEVISGKKVSAITINHEGMRIPEIYHEIDRIQKFTGLPVFDVMEFGAGDLARIIKKNLRYEYTGI